MQPDAVVIGAGPNGLVAANLLADRGWEVLVLEEQAEPGGAVRSGEVAAPGYRHDLFSAFYPLAAGSGVIGALELGRHGLTWRRARGVVAHPAADGRCALLSTELDETCESLDRFAPGDGDSWRLLFRQWERLGAHLVEALLTPFPPVRAAGRLALALRRDLARFARFGLLPVRRLAEEAFRGEGGGWLLAANALHADLPPEAPGSGLYGWVLCGLGQQHGYPVPEGGASELTAALVRRLESRGGEIRCGEPVTRIEVSGGEARAVVTAAGERHSPRRAVLADVGAPALYERLLPRDAVPRRVLADLRRFQYDTGTVKVNWAVREPIPWAAEAARGAGTVHVAEGMDALTDHAGQLAKGVVPDRPFLVLGQYSEADPTRSPPGTDTPWAYTHVPQRIRADAGGDGIEGSWDERETKAFAARMEAEIERLAPGFGDLVVARDVQGPRQLEAANANLVGGALNGGTAQIHQQLLFRPVAGLGRPETPVGGLYLASASAHPGGGVHGGPGANAAQVALRRDAGRRLLRR